MAVSSARSPVKSQTTALLEAATNTPPLQKTSCLVVGRLFDGLKHACCSVAHPVRASPQTQLGAADLQGRARFPVGRSARSRSRSRRVARCASRSAFASSLPSAVLRLAATPSPATCSSSCLSSLVTKG